MLFRSITLLMVIGITSAASLVKRVDHMDFKIKFGHNTGSYVTDEEIKGVNDRVSYDESLIVKGRHERTFHWEQNDQISTRRFHFYTYREDSNEITNRFCCSLTGHVDRVTLGLMTHNYHLRSPKDKSLDDLEDYGLFSGLLDKKYDQAVLYCYPFGYAENPYYVIDSTTLKDTY
ncbi:uncharacterized protein IL334_005559 [Kwoniella shivajii]|uniref:Uncharacterized protein n=1 Tax=Kwoniella shivajii TaxID=564305 RepID=A0ABZ1D417_9TREE|nr:hypothetical protein IL334_005559 [Kwoniella shivajii]